MAEKNSKLKFDDYTRRIVIPEKDKREMFCKVNNLHPSYMYKILSTQRFDMRYAEKRALQDHLRFLAWNEYGGLFENISFTRK